MDEGRKETLIDALEHALKSQNVPNELLQTLLNLAEFMEHTDNALPMDIRMLSDLALRCQAHAKALHYRELEFHASPHTCIEELIAINNNLEQPEVSCRQGKPLLSILCALRWLFGERILGLFIYIYVWMDIGLCDCYFMSFACVMKRGDTNEMAA